MVGYVLLAFAALAVLVFGCVGVAADGTFIPIVWSYVMVMVGIPATIGAIKLTIDENSALMRMAKAYIKEHELECVDVWQYDKVLWLHFLAAKKGQNIKQAVLLTLLIGLVLAVVGLAITETWLGALMTGTMGAIAAFILVKYIQRQQQEALRSKSSAKVYLHTIGLLVDEQFINIGLWGSYLEKLTIEEKNGITYLKFSVNAPAGEYNTIHHYLLPVPKDKKDQLGDILEGYGVRV